MPTYRYFNYFDQFEDIEIDLGPYVEEFSTPDDEIVFSNEQPVITTLPNIFEHIRILTEYRGNVLNFQPYQIQDGERIENVAFNIYGKIRITGGSLRCSTTYRIRGLTGRRPTTSFTILPKSLRNVKDSFRKKLTTSYSSTRTKREGT
jgi:hypothetical protein